MFDVSVKSSFRRRSHHAQSEIMHHKNSATTRTTTAKSTMSTKATVHYNSRLLLLVSPTWSLGITIEAPMVSVVTTAARKILTAASILQAFKTDLLHPIKALSLPKSLQIRILTAKVNRSICLDPQTWWASNMFWYQAMFKNTFEASSADSMGAQCTPQHFSTIQTIVPVRFEGYNLHVGCVDFVCGSVRFVQG